MNFNTFMVDFSGKAQNPFAAVADRTEAHRSTTYLHIFIIFQHLFIYFRVFDFVWYCLCVFANKRISRYVYIYVYVFVGVLTDRPSINRQYWLKGVKFRKFRGTLTHCIGNTFFLVISFIVLYVG